MLHRLPQLAALAAGVLVTTSLTASAAAVEAGSLSLSGPGRATVGETSVLTASGHVPSDAMLERYLNVYAIPTSVVTTCPAEFTNAQQLAYASESEGSDYVAYWVKVEGDFSIPLAYKPRQAGTFVLCGYLHEGQYTDARAQHHVTVDGGQGAGAAPSNLTRPSIKRDGPRLICRKGSWSGNPTSYRYAWLVDGRVRTGATTRTLRITRSVRGSLVKCRVRAANASGSTAATSAAFRVRRG